MAFDLIPALDVAGGRLARLTRGEVESVVAFGGDPLAAAGSMVAAGIRRLHFVDIDLALTGMAANLDLLRAIARLGVAVQSSGGISTARSIGDALDAGADRVVLGSVALRDRELFEVLVFDGGRHVAVGLEVDADRIRARGMASVDLPLEETLAWLSDVPVSRYVVTALPRVGALSGPDLGAVRRILALGKPVVVAGGISSIEHIQSVRREGAEAAVVGRAALEGRLDVRLALELCQDGP